MDMIDIVLDDPNITRAGESHGFHLGLVAEYCRLWVGTFPQAMRLLRLFLCQLYLHGCYLVIRALV